MPSEAKSVTDYFDSVFKDSGRANYILDFHPVAPVDLKFFEYFLRRHRGFPRGRGQKPYENSLRLPLLRNHLRSRRCGKTRRIQ
jgi:hypothetical protein